MNDQYRNTMYKASLKNRLVHAKQVTVTKYENFTLDEFKQIMIEKSPTAIYNVLYSHETPCWHITKLIMTSEGGVWVYANNAADKTPKFKTWKEFYDMIAISGFQPIRF